MKITNIKLKRIDNGSRLAAVASITFDDLIVVHDIKVISGGNSEYFIAMPSRKKSDGTFSDIVHPISSQSRAALEGVLFPAVKKLINENLAHIVFSMDYSADGNEYLSQSLDDFTAEATPVSETAD